MKAFTEVFDGEYNKMNADDKDILHHFLVFPLEAAAEGWKAKDEDQDLLRWFTPEMIAYAFYLTEMRKTKPKKRGKRNAPHPKGEKRNGDREKYKVWKEWYHETHKSLSDLFDREGTKEKLCQLASGVKNYFSGYYKWDKKRKRCGSITGVVKKRKNACEKKGTGEILYFRRVDLLELDSNVMEARNVTGV